MPDPIKPVEDTEEESKSSGVSTEQVTELVTAFKETLKDVVRAQPVAAAPQIATVDHAKEQKRVTEAWTAAKAKANEMAAAGEVAESVEYLQATFMELNKQEAVDQTKTPLFKSMKNSAKRAAKTDHAEMFEKYGPEIEALVAARAAEEQIDSEVWDSMVNQVRAVHIDEIIDSQVESAIQKKINEQPRLSTLVAGSGGSRTKALSQDLTEDQMYVADGLGIGYEDYAKQVAAYTERQLGKNTVMLVAPGNPKPGQF